MPKQNDCSMSFPSEEFYNKLNEEPFNTPIYHHFCKHISSTLKPDNRNIELCYKVVKYLIINAYDHKEKLACKDCNLLNYWIFDQIKSINGEDKTKINIAYGYISHVMSDIMKKYYKSNENKCTFDIYIPFDQNWEAKKEFYEYCQDYKEIKEKKVLTDIGCEKYRDYPKRKPHLLDKFKQILSDDNLKNCPNSDGETGGCDPNVLFAEFSKINDFSETRNDLPDESSKLFLGLSKKNTATAASVAGVSLLGLTLFKLTPLGTWMNRGKQGTNNVIYNLGENNMNELFPSELQPPNMEYDAAAYYLPYNSA